MSSKNDTDNDIFDNNRRRLEVQLEGSSEDSGAVRLGDFQQFLQQLIQTLSAVEHEITNGKRSVTAYRVVELSYASPVRFVLEAVSEFGKQDHGVAVVSRFTKEIEQVLEGNEPQGMDFRTLEIMQGLSAGYKKHLKSIQFNAENKVIPLPQDFDIKIKKLLGNVYRSYGTFRGKLEAVNIHSNPCSVNIYPVAGPTKIRCTYKKGNFPEIGELLETTVDVYGVMLYRGDAPHPHEILIDSITPLLPKDQLPTTEEIIGSMSGLTDGMDIESYLRRIRHEELA